MKRFIFLCLSIFLFSCEDNEDVVTLFSYTTIAQGNLFGNGAEKIGAEQFLIRTKADWDKLKAKMNTVNNVTAEFDKTVIDFDTEQVIAVFDNIKNSGGHSIDVVNIFEDETTIILRIERLNTGDLTSVITQPFHIIRMAKSNKAVAVQE